MPVAIKNLDEVKAELKALRAKKEAKRPIRERKDWYGNVYCDSNGYASIMGNDLEGIWLGKTEELIPYLKSRGIDGENYNMVIEAAKEFRSEKKSQSCHLARENDTTSVITPESNPNRATFKDNPHFLRLLDGLITEGCGTPTIQKRLREEGYDVPYRTLGRWVNKRKAGVPKGDSPITARKGGN